MMSLGQLLKINFCLKNPPNLEDAIFCSMTIKLVRGTRALEVDNLRITVTKLI